MSICKHILITGANRGIGFQLLRQLLREFKPEKVFATFRDPDKSKELHELAGKHKGVVQLIQLDVRDFDRYDEVAKSIDSSIEGSGLNLLINNSGITSKFAKLSGTRRNDLLENFEINTVAPIMLTKALLPSLEKAGMANPEVPMGIEKAAVVNMSSVLGSIQSNDQGGMYPYRCSKAALNAASKSMGFDLKRSNIIAISLHPGWVKTDMGGPKAPLSPEESAASIIKFLTRLEAKHSGNFYQYDGQQLPW